jgi:hypothetical protein
MPIEKSSEPCPKCGRFYVAGEASCSSCGLVFSKWRERAEGAAVSGSSRMDLAWQDVLNRWTDESMHKKFVDQCLREHNLPFASLKYRRVLESDPHNEAAQRMQKQIQETVIAGFGGALRSNPAKESSYRMVYFFVMLSALLMVAGFNLPSSYATIALPLAAVGILAFVAIQMLKRMIN